MLIIPALLSDQVPLIQSQLDRVQSESNLTRVQIDIVDPEFADNITIYPVDIAQLDLHAFQIDVHLMTNDPINDLVECAHVPGINSVIAQVEHMGNQRAFINQARSYNLKVGLALDLTTPIEAIEPDIWKELACVQVMGIKAGAQGETFDPKVLSKVTALKTAHPELETIVDGGVKPDTFPSIKNAGAASVAVGSFLWESENLSQAIAKLV